MRDPSSFPNERLPPDVRKALLDWRPKQDDPRLRQPAIKEGYEMAIIWQAVQRMMQCRALREASEARKILLYVQAVDICARQNLDAAEYRRALQVVNTTHTGRLMGMCPLFVGMKVWLCSKLCAKHGLVHDAPGEVVGFQFHPKEDLSWRRPGSDASKTGYHLLRYLPEAVLVKFAVDEDFGFG